MAGMIPIRPHSSVTTTTTALINTSHSVQLRKLAVTPWQIASAASTLVGLT
jgi:hypothetical protein